MYCHFCSCVTFQFYGKIPNLVNLPPPFDFLVEPINYLFNQVWSFLKIKIDAMFKIMLTTCQKVISGVAQTVCDLLIGFIDVANAAISDISDRSEDLVNSALGVFEIGITYKIISEVTVNIRTILTSCISTVRLVFNGMKIQVPQIGLPNVDMGATKVLLQNESHRLRTIFETAQFDFKNPTLPDLPKPDLSASELVQSNISNKLSSFKIPDFPEMPSLGKFSPGPLDIIRLMENHLWILVALCVLFLLLKLKP